MNAMNEQTRAAVEEVRRTDCEFLTVPQVAKILKVNKNMVYDLISVKLLRAVKLGSTKVATIAVEDFIREMNPTADIQHMSANTGEGIDYAVDKIDKEYSARYDESMEEFRLQQEYNKQAGE